MLSPSWNFPPWVLRHGLLHCGGLWHDLLHRGALRRGLPFTSFVSVFTVVTLSGMVSPPWHAPSWGSLGPIFFSVYLSRKVLSVIIATTFQADPSQVSREWSFRHGVLPRGGCPTWLSPSWNFAPWALRHDVVHRGKLWHGLFHRAMIVGLSDMDSLF